MTDGAREQLFAYLANRYRDARTNVDELRQRALELVIAGCVADTRTAAVGGIPPPRPPAPTASAEDSIPGAAADEPKAIASPGPDSAPPAADPVTEEDVASGSERESEPVEPAKPSEPRIVPDPNISLEPPAGPNRGFWGPPDE